MNFNHNQGKNCSDYNFGPIIIIKKKKKNKKKNNPNHELKIKIFIHQSWTIINGIQSHSTLALQFYDSEQTRNRSESIHKIKQNSLKIIPKIPVLSKLSIFYHKMSVFSPFFSSCTIFFNYSIFSSFDCIKNTQGSGEGAPCRVDPFLERNGSSGGKLILSDNF